MHFLQKLRSFRSVTKGPDGGPGDCHTARACAADRIMQKLVKVVCMSCRIQSSGRELPQQWDEILCVCTVNPFWQVAVHVLYIGISHALAANCWSLLSGGDKADRGEGRLWRLAWGSDTSGSSQSCITLHSNLTYAEQPVSSQTAKKEAHNLGKASDLYRIMEKWSKCKNMKPPLSSIHEAWTLWSMCSANMYSAANRICKVWTSHWFLKYINTILKIKPTVWILRMHDYLLSSWKKSLDINCEIHEQLPTSILFNFGTFVIITGGMVIMWAALYRVQKKKKKGKFITPKCKS